jgi:hypothetical protein
MLQPLKDDSLAANIDWQLVGLLPEVGERRSAVVVQAKRQLPSCRQDSMQWFGKLLANDS